MVRTVKDPELRRKEIMDAAERLFSQKGYDGTSVKDIVEEVGVAHGLFYYYFDSKEAVVDAMVQKMVEQLMTDVQGIVDSDELNALEKFNMMMLQSLERKKERFYLISFYQGDDKSPLLSKYMGRTMCDLAPLIARIVEQGVEEGVFNTPYPQKAVEFWLYGRLFMVRRFMKEPSGAMEYLKAEVRFLEKILEAEEGVLSGLWEELYHGMDDMITEVEV